MSIYVQQICITIMEWSFIFKATSRGKSVYTCTLRRGKPNRSFMQYLQLPRDVILKTREDKRVSSAAKNDFSTALWVQFRLPPFCSAFNTSAQSRTDCFFTIMRKRCAQRNLNKIAYIFRFLCLYFCWLRGISNVSHLQRPCGQMGLFNMVRRQMQLNTIVSNIVNVYYNYLLRNNK